MAIEISSWFEWRRLGRKARFVRVFVVCLFLAGCALLVPPHRVRYALYPVKQGDSLSDISAHFGVSVQDIVEHNDLGFSGLPQPGRVLKIPLPPKETAVTGSSDVAKKVERDPRSLRMVRLNQARQYIGSLVWPLQKFKLTSRFGYRSSSFHEGLDLSAEEGAPIFAAHSGIVVYSARRINGYGNMIILKGEHIMTVYAHNSANLVDFGDEVEAGDQIAEVGETGRATGPHLHFEIRIKDASGRNAAVDPLVFYPQRKP